MQNQRNCSEDELRVRVSGSEGFTYQLSLLLSLSVTAGAQPMHN